MRGPLFVKTLITPLWIISLSVAVAAGADRDDILIADFEGDDYGDWAARGEAFGPGPAKGTLPGQMGVSGFRGEGLVNSFYQGDRTTGTLTSIPYIQPGECWSIEPAGIALPPIPVIFT